MKSVLNKFTLALGIIFAGILLPGNALASCIHQGKSSAGVSTLPQTWNKPVSLMAVSDDSGGDPIVGMWHVTFTAEGNTGAGAPPDGAPIDNALVVWHSDGTEIMNSARPAQDGNFCLGVWERVGKNRYKLNHIPWLSNDTTNAPSGIGNPQGPTRIFQEITLSHDGKHYTGTFILDAFDTAGNNVAHIIGAISATRITVDTTVNDLL
jgi:hypothetical protein